MGGVVDFGGEKSWGGLSNFQDSGGGFHFAGGWFFQGGFRFSEKNSPAAGSYLVIFQKIRLRRAIIQYLHKIIFTPGYKTKYLQGTSQPCILWNPGYKTKYLQSTIATQQVRVRFVLPGVNRAGSRRIPGMQTWSWSSTLLKDWLCFCVFGGCWLFVGGVPDDMNWALILKSLFHREACWHSLLTQHNMQVLADLHVEPYWHSFIDTVLLT